MLKHLAAVLVSLSLSGAALAAAWSSLEIRANRPASVFVDGQPHGRAPVTIRVAPGVHAVKVVDETTGFERNRPFLAPETHAVNQVLDIEFQGGVVLTEADRTARAAAAPPPAQVVTAAPRSDLTPEMQAKNPAWAGNVWWRRFPTGRSPSIHGIRGYRGR